MATCWRCGVEWDDTDYLTDVPCTDCQLEDLSIEYRRLDVVKESEKRRLDYLVRLGWESHQSDRVISERIGLNERQVTRARVRMGLKGHTDLGGTASWTNVTAEEVAAASRAYWSDPENRKRRRKHGPPVEGGLEADRHMRTREEIDKRYGD